MSKATVLIPQGLRAFTHGAPVVTVSADTVGAALKAVDEQAHGFLARILTAEQELRPLVNIFVGEFSIREKDGLQTRLADGDIIAVIPAVAGG